MNGYFFAVLIFLGYCCAAAQSFEEELKLFGAEDFLLLDDTDTSKNDETAAQIQDSASQIDSVQSVEPPANSEHKTERASGARRGGMSAPSAASGVTPMPVGAGQGRPTDTSFVKISVFDTAAVSRETSIDFSRGLSQYRNPQKALFYSLLLPGLGQAYNKKYWRTGLYAAIEIGMITGAVYFRRDAKKNRIVAEKFADDHFEKGRLEKFYRELTEYGNNNPHFDEAGDKENVGGLIFGFESGFYDGVDTAGYEKYLQEFDLDFYGDRYGVGSAFGVQGWDDAAPDYGVGKYPKFYPDNYSLDTMGFHVIIDGKNVFGVSQNQNEYNSMIDYSRKQVQRSSAFVVGIFVNHIASAADAFVSAIINNRKLLKEEDGKSTKVEDVLSRISIDSGMYLDYENNLTSKLGLVWRF